MGVTPSLTGQLRTTAMAPKVKLTYFNLRDRAEPSRLLLAYGGIKYEDCRLTPAFEDPKEWSALKPKTPYGSLPLLEWNGTCIAQSMAVARFIAREVGLAGRCNMESAQIDEIIDAINDMVNAGARAFFSKDEALMKKHEPRRSQPDSATSRKDWSVAEASTWLVTPSAGLIFTSSISAATCLTRAAWTNAPRSRI